jgi:hypothetical protein
MLTLKGLRMKQVEFRYQLSVCSRTQGIYEKFLMIWPVVGMSGFKLSSSWRSGIYAHLWPKEMVYQIPFDHTLRTGKSRVN